MRKLLAAGLLWTVLAAMQAAPAPARPDLEMWRLDCGEIRVTNLDVFSDSYLYEGREKTLTDSCYLVRSGENYLLWDTGLSGALAGLPEGGQGPFRFRLRERITAQLARIGVDPARVNFVGISHYHDDHIGQAADFPRATLLVGTGDWEAIRARPESAARFRPWIDGGSTVRAVPRDHDVFGDGRVVMLYMPGHTPGHHALLVRLRSGAVLLTGDLFHFTEQIRNRGVPSFNTDRADTLASFDRFLAIARNLRARIIIQHEPGHVGRLPAFPASAR